MSFRFDRPTILFIILGGFFIANALVAEFIGVKIFQMETTFGFLPVDWTILGQKISLQYTAGVLLWPVVFIMTDVINEYYGSRGVKILSYLAVALIGYAFVMIYGAINLQPADWWVGNYQKSGVSDMQSAFGAVFGQGLLIIIGSMVAFLVGQIIDVAVFHKIKQWTGERKVWLRATGSTLISQLIDSFVVLYIAFYLGPRLFPDLSSGEPWTWVMLLAIGANNYIYKFIMAVLLTPIIYLAHNIIDGFLGVGRAKRMKAEAALN